jgi:hypothetical protein
VRALARPAGVRPLDTANLSPQLEHAKHAHTSARNCDPVEALGLVGNTALGIVFGVVGMFVKIYGCFRFLSPYGLAGEVP